jgi:DNA polymerase-1
VCRRHPRRSAPRCQAPHGDARQPGRVSVATSSRSPCAVRPFRRVRCSATAGTWRFGVAAGNRGARRRDAGSGPELVGALGERSIVAHDAKALGVVPRRPLVRHDGRRLPARPCASRLPAARAAARTAASRPSGRHGRRPRSRLLAAPGSGPSSSSASSRRSFDEVELPLVGVLRAMELAGIALDLAAWRRSPTRVNEEVGELERAIHAAAGEEFLIGSPQQLGAILFEKLELSRKRRGKTGYSTDARVLAAIRDEHEIVPMIERWRELSTLVKTYLEPLPGLVDERSRLHTTFVQTVAATGRLSSTNPNLQNVPIRTPLGREIRGCFVAGSRLRAARRRLLAGRAADPRPARRRAGAQEIFRARRGRPHRHRLPGLRRRARGARRRHALEGEDGQLRDRLRPDRLRPRRPPADPARGGGGIHRDLLRALPRCASSSSRRSRRRSSRATSRRCSGAAGQIPELRARNRQQQALGERLAVNTVIQGTAADIIKVAMVRVQRAIAGCARA